MSDFVGFAKSPKLPAEAEQLVLELDVESPMPIDSAAKTLFSKDGAFGWLGETLKFDLAPGGKIITDELTFTVTEVTLPKTVTLVCEELGEVHFSLRKGNDGCAASIRFSRWALPADTEKFWQTARTLGAKLQQILEVNVG